MSTGQQTRAVSGPKLVTTGRATTIVRTALGLALLAWMLRPAVGTMAPHAVLMHHKALSGGLMLAFVFVPAALIATLTIICLNRVLLHAVAWCTAGAVANLGELLATGAVADYVPVGASQFSAGDVYLSVGIGLLALGAVRVVYDGRAAA